METITYLKFATNYGYRWNLICNIFSFCYYHCYNLWIPLHRSAHLYFILHIFVVRRRFRSLVLTVYGRFFIFMVLVDTFHYFIIVKSFFSQKYIFQNFCLVFNTTDTGNTVLALLVCLNDFKQLHRSH